ncbi:MAG TPA: peptidoglycan DD-metalloendopeptidase family protein [Leptospiraceae bacterium]|nr:peptidoglycan DD-metalloendopeptidase family protein [Leptospiraceae bacterium]HMZ60363.1 peptidoglycan DD-metalloendopeptidase family protein [Leptospiraceae bacterium]HNF14587.1 peptidoglycan DD-metalloendopeptidase family protein [Leptospiraceae bacterium]HNM03340.1 peptidoglycan DD-metalloendopeptidase family protein [Leptospiraceae bacterium]HNN03258.1 peptidoglycan DD-metalloendopeptidase family protein [Leptospiraceae bacterium]
MEKYLSALGRVICVFAALSVNEGVLSDSEKPAEKKTADSFAEKFNSDDFPGIFEMFSPSLQKSLTLSKTEEFLKGVKLGSGRMKKKQFQGYSKNAFASYLAVCEYSKFTLELVLDKDSRISGYYIRTVPAAETDFPKIERNISRIQFPAEGVWSTTWGGDTKELNYHVEKKFQKNAFDFVIRDERNSSYKNDGKKNEDYYAFGKELFAPADGIAVYVKDGFPDNKPGEKTDKPNEVIIRTENGEYVVLLHFKKNSIAVKQGEKIKRGQLLGLVGNSGFSSEPHIHFHMMNGFPGTAAAGIKCFFDRISVNGKSRKDYSPIKGDRISRD